MAVQREYLSPPPGGVPLGGIDRVAAPLREQVTTEMRNAIMHFQLRPGQRLVERELVERFAVSRTTVREALRDLESEGLVTVVPQRGAIVSVPSPQEANDLYDIRAHLESLAVARFVDRATPDEVAALDATVDELERITGQTPDDTFAILLAKDRFYGALFAGAGSVVLEQVISSIQARVRALRATSLGVGSRSTEAIAELRGIMNAIQAGDAATAAERSVQHVRNAATTALSELAAEPDA